MSIIKRLNEISEEMYGEFGFSTLNEQEMETVLKQYELEKPSLSSFPPLFK